MVQREQKGGLGFGLWALLLGLGLVFVILLILGGVYVHARLRALPEEPAEEPVKLRGPTEW